MQQMQLPLRGACQCGNVTYSVREAPLFCLACHCKDCQKLSAAAFSPTLVFRAEAFSTTGTLKMWESRADSGRRKHAFFCPECGNRIYHLDPDAPALVRLKPGTLDTAEIPPPQAHVWVSRKQPWMVIPEGTPAFTENADPAFMQGLLRGNR